MAMTERLSSDRRRHLRVPLSAKVTLYHVPSKRTFPARSVDISESGMLMYVPAGTPVSLGQEVELTIEPRVTAQAAPAAQLRHGKVVRVDRPLMLKTAHLPVAVQFEPLP